MNEQNPTPDNISGNTRAEPEDGVVYDLSELEAEATALGLPTDSQVAESFSLESLSDQPGAGEASEEVSSSELDILLSTPTDTGTATPDNSVASTAAASSSTPTGGAPAAASGPTAATGAASSPVPTPAPLPASPAGGSTPAPTPTPTVPPTVATPSAAAPVTPTTPAAPTLTTGYEVDESATYVNSLNISSAASEDMVLLSAVKSISKIGFILSEVDVMLSHYGIQSINFQSIPILDYASLQAQLSRAMTICTNKVQSLSTLQEPQVRKNLSGSLFHAANIAQLTLLASAKRQAELSPAPPAPTPPAAPVPPAATGTAGGGAPAGGGVPAVDPNLKAQLDDAWSALEVELRSELHPYTTKITAIRDFISLIEDSNFGDVDLEPAKSRLKEARQLRDACQGILANFISSKVSFELPKFESEAVRIHNNALGATSAEQIKNIRDEAKRLHDDFDSRVSTSKNVQVETEIERPPRSNKYVKSRTTINLLGNSEIVISVLFARTIKILRDNISNTFFDTQSARIEAQEKTKGSDQENKTKIEKMAGEISLRIDKVHTDIITAANHNKASSSSWKAFVETDYPELIRIANREIKNFVDSIRSTAGASDSLKAHANGFLTPLVTKVTDFNTVYDTTIKNKIPAGRLARELWNIYITVPDVFDKGKDSLKTFRPPFISRINLVIPSLDSTPSTAYAASNGYSSPHAGSSGYKWAGAAAAAVSALAALAFLATPAKDPNEGKEKTTAEAKAAADLKATLEEVAAARRKLEEAARQKQEAGRRAAAAQQARPEQMTVQQPKSSAKERVAEFYREITHLNNISLYDIMDFKGRRAEDFLLGGDDGRNVMDTLRAPRARPTAVDAGMPQISAAMIIESILGAKLKDIRGNVSIAHTPKELAWWYDVGPAQEKFVLYRDMGAGTTTILFRNDVGVDQIKVIAKSADTGTLNVGELLGKNGKRFEFIADCAQRGDFTDKCKELVSKLSPSK